jgi:hypothetical protein
LIARLDQQHAGAGELRFGRRRLVGRHEAGVKALPDIAEVRFRPLHGLLQDDDRGACRDDGPVGTGRFEPQVGTRDLDVLAGRVRFGSCRAFERVGPATAVDRPLQVES